jgi:hypothetical protein
MGRNYTTEANTMGDLFQPMHLLIIGLFLPVILAMTVLPYWKIFGKAGFPPALSLLMFIPLANLIVLYYVAFTDWKPAEASRL